MQHQWRIASWNAAPERPYQTAPERFVAFYRPTVGLFLACLLLPVLLIVLGLIPSLSFGLIVAASGAALGVLLCTIGAIRHARRWEPEADDRDWTDPLPRMNAKVQLFAKGYLYGEDRGELTIVDDWLIFEGERTSFSLAPHDVAAHRSRQKVSGRYAVDFKLTFVGADTRVKIIAADPHRDPASFLSSWSMLRMN